MAQKKEIVFLTTGIILLIPVIFFPITTDLAIFIQAGKIIAYGGKPYVDFIDIKPPLIYYIYALIYSITGSGELALRLFDFVIQVITVFLLSGLIKKYANNEKWARWSVILYGISYTVLSHNQTMQIESWVPLLSILMISFALKYDKNIYFMLFAGFSAGLIMSLKFSMFFIIFLLPLADYFSGNFNGRQIFKRFSVFLLGSISIFLLSLLPFLDSSIRSGFGNVLAYLSVYAQYPPLNAEFIRFTLKNLAEFFGDKYSLMFSIFLFTGIFYAIKKYAKDENSRLKQFINISVSALILLMLSVIAEKKFFPYHFSRLYAFFAMFAAAGIISFSETIKTIYTERRKHILTVLLISAFLLLLSPLPRWTALLNPTLNYFANKQKYEAYYTRQAAVLLSQQRAVANYIKKNSSPHDKALVVSVASSIINYYLDTLALNKFMLSSFYISAVDIKPWKHDAYKLLKQSSWIVLQENDISYLANAHFMSSKTAFIRNRVFAKYFIDNFKLVRVTGSFYIYKKNQHPKP